MADSSIGGKVGVDLEGGKNLVGHFWHPARVFVDPACLETLPPRERISGWVEIIKHGIIADARHFGWLERNARRLLDLKPASMEEILARSLRIKARIVRRDERESEYRMVLNYGHTVGHAIETLTGYRKFIHGEAVAKGMAVEGRIARNLGLWKDADLHRQNCLLERLGANISFPDLPVRDVLRVLGRDKKAAAGEVRFPLPRRIGAMHTREGKVGIQVHRRVILGAIREAS
jgi:3-dehydroquinate synthase